MKFYLLPLLSTQKDLAGNPKRFLRIQSWIASWKSNLLSFQLLLVAQLEVENQEAEGKSVFRRQFKEMLLFRWKAQLSMLEELQERLTPFQSAAIPSSYLPLLSNSLPQSIPFLRQKLLEVVNESRSLTSQKYSVRFLEEMIRFQAIENGKRNSGLIWSLFRPLESSGICNPILSSLGLGEISLPFTELHSYFRAIQFLLENEDHFFDGKKFPSQPFSLLRKKLQQSFSEIFSFPLLPGDEAADLVTTIIQQNFSRIQQFQFQIFGRQHLSFESIHLQFYGNYWNEKLSSSPSMSVLREIDCDLLLLKNYVCSPILSFYYSNNNFWINRSNNGWIIGKTGEGIHLTALWNSSLKTQLLDVLYAFLKLSRPSLLLGYSSLSLFRVAVLSYQRLPSPEEKTEKLRQRTYFDFDFMCLTTLPAKELQEIGCALDFVFDHILLFPAGDGGEEDGEEGDLSRKQQTIVQFHRLLLYISKAFHVVAFAYVERFLSMVLCSLMALVRSLRPLLIAALGLPGEEEQLGAVLGCLLSCLR